MNIFYAPDITPNVYMLNEEESKHCIRVLRMQIGEQLILIDGKGGYYIAKIADAHPKRCLLTIEETYQNFEKRDYSLHIAIAPTKNIERIEWFVEKAVEIGIDQITPIFCDRSERKFVNTDRLEKIAIAAIKQSIKAFKPIINEAVQFNTFIKQATATNKMIAHCAEGHKNTLKDICKPSTDSILLIGPEGDFSEKEVETALTTGYQAISLGKSRLRTETAGVAACCFISQINEII